MKSLAVVGATLALLLAGCGGGQSGSASGSLESSTGSSTATAEVAAAKAYEQERLRTDVDLPMPTEPVVMGDKRVAVINVGLNNAYGTLVHKFVDEAAAATGWNVKEFDAAQDLTKISGFMIQAVQEQYDAVIIMVTPVDAVAAATQTVLDAGIPLICLSCSSQGAFAGKVVDISGDWADQAKSIAAALIARNGVETKIVRFNEPAYYSIQFTTDALVSGAAELCGSCAPVKVEQFAVQDMAKPGPPAWSAFLASNPPGSYTDVVAPFDDAAKAFQATEDQNGRDDIAVSSTASTGDFITAIKEGRTRGVATAEAVSFQVWSAFDLAARAMDGKALWDATNLYSPLVEPANADKFLPDGDYVPDGQDFVAEFKALWQ